MQGLFQFSLPFIALIKEQETQYLPVPVQYCCFVFKCCVLLHQLSFHHSIINAVSCSDLNLSQQASHTFQPSNNEIFLRINYRHQINIYYLTWTCVKISQGEGRLNGVKEMYYRRGFLTLNAWSPHLVSSLSWVLHRITCLSLRYRYGKFVWFNLIMPAMWPSINIHKRK